MEFWHILARGAITLKVANVVWLRINGTGSANHWVESSSSTLQKTQNCIRKRLKAQKKTTSFWQVIRYLIFTLDIKYSGEELTILSNKTSGTSQHQDNDKEQVYPKVKSPVLLIWALIYPWLFHSFTSLCNMSITIQVVKNMWLFSVLWFQSQGFGKSVQRVLRKFE